MVLTSLHRHLKWWACTVLVCLTAACASGGHHDDADQAVAVQQLPADLDWVALSRIDGASSIWQHRAFPGKKSTRYSRIELDGRSAVQSDSTGSASMLRQHLRVEPAALGTLRFSWKVPALIANADMTRRETDDSPVRVVLAFDGDRSNFSAKNAMLSELAMVLTGEPLPYASLMYVWGNRSPAGSVIVNPRTDRIRKLVLESGPQGLGRWIDYQRDIRADYEKAFGEPPGALIGIGIMTDSDNTSGRSMAWYGPLSLDAPGVERRSPQAVLSEPADTRSKPVLAVVSSVRE